MKKLSDKEFKEYIDQNAQIFLDAVEVWLNEHCATSEEQVSKTNRLGAGAYATMVKRPRRNSNENN